jgi:N-methylhydantoinase A
LRIPKVIIPRFSSTHSAFGMLVSNVVKDYVQTIMLRGIVHYKSINKYFSPMINRGMRDIKNQGVQEDQIELQRSLDIRYVGQSYELNIPFDSNFLEVFHEIHNASYGYAYFDKPIEIVNIRVRAIGKVPSIRLPQAFSQLKNNKPQIKRSVSVLMRDLPDTIPLYIYDQLTPGMRLEGPALIVSTDTTILVDYKDIINIDEYQNLLIDVYQSDQPQ